MFGFLSVLRPRPLLACLLLLPLSVHAGKVLHDDFAKSKASDWIGTKDAVIKDGALFFSISGDAATQSQTLARALPVEALRGRTVLISSEVRAENVDTPPKPWNGVKLMLQIDSADGTRTYPQAKIDSGTLARKTVRFATEVPEDAVSVSVVAGLENVSGKAWFSDLRVLALGENAAERNRAPLRSGEVVFSLDLADEGVRALIESQGGMITRDGPGGSTAVRFDSQSPAGALAMFRLDAERLRGCTIEVVAKARAEKIRGEKEDRALPAYLGGKLQIALESPGTGRRWLEPAAFQGSFDWTDVRAYGGIMTDEKSAFLRIGVEQAIGTVWFTDLEVRVVKAPAPRPEPSAQIRDAVAAAKTTRRGMMSPQVFKAQDFDDLQAWNVNVVRWQMWQLKTDTRPYDEWLKEEIEELALALDAAAARGMQLVVDLHPPPGGRVEDRTFRMYLEKEYAEKFVGTWVALARRFAGHAGLWAYDLVNEPVQNTASPAGLDDWLALQATAARAIRAVDAKTPIMIETDQWCSPESFTWLAPLEIPGLIYQVHMYWPGKYTHQGVHTDQGVADGHNGVKTFVYPGTIDNAPFDKEALRRYLKPVRDFQLSTGAPIFVGEFSAIRWAPGADRYLEDLISIFEEYGWDWTYHAFREWPGWSVEHADLPASRHHHPKAEEPTARLKVLLKSFEKNSRQPRS